MHDDAARDLRKLIHASQRSGLDGLDTATGKIVLNAALAEINKNICTNTTHIKIKLRMSRGNLRSFRSSKFKVLGNFIGSNFGSLILVIS